MRQLCSHLKNEEQFEELNGPRKMTYACRLGLKRQNESVKNFYSLVTSCTYTEHRTNYLVYEVKR